MPVLWHWSVGAGQVTAVPLQTPEALQVSGLVQLLLSLQEVGGLVTAFAGWVQPPDALQTSRVQKRPSSGQAVPEAALG